MCGTCGCGDPPTHDATHADERRMVEIEEQVLSRNDHVAGHNRDWLRDRDVLALNLMSSPGSGKTTLLERTVRELALPVAVVEGDQATQFDADRIEATGAPVLQINTGAGCHLDAEMLRRALGELDPVRESVLFVENVGNLVCPALFDLGEEARVVVMSVTEGVDKPLKYPHMFASSDLVVVNKVDLLPHVDFDLEAFGRNVRLANPDVEVLTLSATTGEGLEDWYGWLRHRHRGFGDAGDRFARASAVADAVLYEGYALYPYRGSAGKNQNHVRWQFGVLAPRPWIEPRVTTVDGVAGSAESWWQQTECLLEAPGPATLDLRVRHLQLQRGPEGSGTPFDQAVPVEHDLAITVEELLRREHSVTFTAPGDPGLGREQLVLVVRASIVPAPAPFPLHRLRVRIENADEGADPDLAREEALRRSLLATHCLLGVDQGAFCSQMDPPEWASEAAQQCENVRTFPVLAGAASERDLVLSAPIILYDHPEVAPESPGDLHDASEIDEILSLRTRTLTEEEKREARATDPRVAELLDRVEAMPPEVMDRLHGAVRSLRQVRSGAEPGPDDATNENGEPTTRWWGPGADVDVDPQRDTVVVDGIRLARGSQVRLRPRHRGTDAHDMFLAGRTARVERVLRDVNDHDHVAVTIEDDPSAELHQWYGRFHYYGLDEVEPL